MGKITFEPADGVARVELAVQHRDDLIVVEGPTDTDDPVVIAALDRHPLVRRAQPPRRKESD